MNIPPLLSTEAADQSNVDALRTLAAVYHQGWANGERDFDRSFEYSQKAAGGYM